MLEIADSGANIHLAKQASTKMAPVIMSNEMTARITYGSTMDSSHIATLHILLGVLFDDGCTITLDKQDMSVHKNGLEII